MGSTVSHLEPECSGTTPNGLVMDLSNHGEVWEVQVLPAFFCYDSEKRLCQETDLSSPTLYRALRNKYLKRFNNLAGESRQYWQLRDIHDQGRFTVQREIDDLVTRDRKKTSASDRRKKAAALARMYQRQHVHETELAHMTSVVNIMIDRTAIARGRVHALDYIHKGTCGTPCNGNRAQLAAARNEATRWVARECVGREPSSRTWSDEITVTCRY